MTQLTHTDLETHARHWIAAWNAHDVGAVLTAFAEDAVFISPLAAQVTGRAQIAGIAALRGYWTEALRRAPDLRFELNGLAIDEAGQSVTVFYTSHAAGRARHACEHMQFRHGKQILGEAYYGCDA
ncbi:MAG: nuclear transport factor 2 family protein [Cereibacter changlensis]